MHPKSSAVQSATADRDGFEREHYDCATDGAGLVLEELPNGESAWLRPAVDRRYVLPSRYVLTDQGRRALAMANCFGPWPTVAEAVR
jgi:hypothetical protein